MYPKSVLYKKMHYNNTYLTMTAAIIINIMAVKSKLSVTITASTAGSEDTPGKLKLA